MLSHLLLNYRASLFTLYACYVLDVLNYSVFMKLEMSPQHFHQPSTELNILILWISSTCLIKFFSNLDFVIQLFRFLLYLDPLFKLGSERTLLHSDLGFINKKDQCKNVQIIFDKYWEIEQKKPLKKQSLWMVSNNFFII